MLPVRTCKHRLCTATDGRNTASGERQDEPTFHICQIKPSQIASSLQRLVEPLNGGLHSPLVAQHHVLLAFRPHLKLVVTHRHQRSLRELTRLRTQALLRYCLQSRIHARISPQRISPRREEHQLGKALGVHSLIPALDVILDIGPRMVGAEEEATDQVLDEVRICQQAGLVQVRYAQV